MRLGSGCVGTLDSFVTWRPSGRPCSWGFGCISVSAGAAAGGFALTASPFGKRPKGTKGLCPDVRLLAVARGSFAPGSIRGASLPVCFAAPPFDVFDFVERRCAPTPGSIPPFSLPTGSKIKSRRADTRPIEWLRADVRLLICVVAAPHPSPLPREREPICELFRI